MYIYIHTCTYFFKSCAFLVSPNLSTLFETIYISFFTCSQHSLLIRILYQLILIIYSKCVLLVICYSLSLASCSENMLLDLDCYSFKNHIHTGRVKKLSIISLAHFFLRNQQSAHKLLIEKFSLILCYQTKYVLQL